MPKGDPPTSPWTWTGSDYLGRSIIITIPFDNVTLALLDGGTIHRDVGCLWSRIVWGAAPNEIISPSVPEGDTPITAAQILAFSGFATYDELISLSIQARA